MKCSAQNRRYELNASSGQVKKESQVNKEQIPHSINVGQIPTCPVTLFQRMTPKGVKGNESLITRRNMSKEGRWLHDPFP
jgi:hypothetical protein